MNITVRQLVALDRALAQGVTITWDGKDYVFSPLTFDDFAEHLAHRKSIGLKVWMEVAAATKLDPRQRIRDLCTLTSRSATDEDFSLGEPDNVKRMSFLSLRHKHPDITLAEVDKLLSDDAKREMLADLLQVMESVPADFDKEEGGGDASSNPT